MTTERLADSAEIALAHAMWEAANFRPMAPNDVEYHVSRASEVIRYLRMFGFDVVRIQPIVGKPHIEI